MAKIQLQPNNLTAAHSAMAHNIVPNTSRCGQYTPSFGAAGGNVSKKCWLHLRRLSNYMKDVSEFTNATIAAIGTGIIAPLVIMVSPGKGDKKDKDKKFFQAIRQPLSAGLALAFQVPATFAVNSYINKLAYKDKIKFFNDETLGSLIPDKKYLGRQVTKEEISALEAQFDKTGVGGKSLHKELEDKIRAEYEEVGITASDEEIAKRVAKDKKKFLREKIVETKHKELLEAKYNELKGKGFEIKDTDLVTEDIKKLAEHRNQTAYKALEENAKLNTFDRFMSLIGFDTKKVKDLKAKQDAFKVEKGLEILKTDEKKLFEGTSEGMAERLKKFIEVKDGKAQKFFGNKKFWLSLLINLFMVTASCYALNWAHPRTKKLIDKYQHRNDDTYNNSHDYDKHPSLMKVEVNK